MVAPYQAGCTIFRLLSLPNRQPIYRFTVHVAHDPLPSDVARLPLAIHAMKRLNIPDFFGCIDADVFFIWTTCV